MNLHPANLWIGPEQELHAHVLSVVQKLLCPHQGCGTCHRCVSIVERQHHALTWLEPENYYTVKQIQQIFTRVCFALQPGEKHIIILDRADLFNTASANSLLKSLEEPPEGYHYILLAPRMEGILPTIRSRCVVRQFDAGKPLTHRLLPFFTSYSFVQAPALMKEIQKERIPEREIDQLLDAAVHHWQEEYKKALLHKDDKKSSLASAMVQVIEHARRTSPMPGSSKVFLKNIYLQMALAF